VNDENQSRLKQSRRRRALGLIIVVVGVAASWGILSEGILGIDRKYAFWVPVYLLLLVLYWVPAWAAIATRMEDVPENRSRLAKGGGCLFVAFVVFLLICALLAIVFMG
jgi:membrane protease YdiL (CAAX protease family)